MKKIALHWQIIIGLFLGLIYGFISTNLGWGSFTTNWIAPFGTIFINLLKLIAMPLVLASLITGVASLSDVKKLSRIGGKTISIYIGTTALAVTIGLFSVNILKPGDKIPTEMKEKLQTIYEKDAANKASSIHKVKSRGPLQPIVDMVPNNFFNSASNNRNMLQVVFVAILIGVGLIQIPEKNSKPLKLFFKSLSDVVIKLVDIIMLIAPIGVFALISQTINKVAGDNPSQVLELLGALGFYMFSVILGLIIHVIITYMGMMRFFTKMKVQTFFKGLAPAQLLAFSTSSSGATLPVTMERCEEKLGVSEEVSSFVLPLGATINMDGTALYQAVAAVFIAQAFGLDLSLVDQLGIISTATLASIGAAAVPSAGIIVLVIVLAQAGIPEAGLALIFAVDRPLDMFRTVVNVTGDAMVSLIVSKFQKS